MIRNAKPGGRAAAVTAVLTALLSIAAAGASPPRPALLRGSASAAAQQAVPFRAGMVVTESTRIAPGRYEVAAPASLEAALIVVRGDGITLDMTGVELHGQPVEADPDLAAGVAVRVDGGTDVTLRGATIRGYRFALLARGTRDLRLLDNELSYNWKPRLFSQLTHESLVDWLSFHDNEDRQWMRFGAAIYLEDVRGGVISGNRAVQGMNGLLMTRTDGVLVVGNELAFNSGLGVGLYRSSSNVLVNNRLDFNVRGYSDGYYQRGQDSAAILLYEQSNDNVIAHNSATHSGDGFFLWAGNSTMETGEGGANDNLLFGNDFSFAPTNAVEVTFSRNQIIANRLDGSRYGVWGGYSYETLIAGNCIGGNEFGIAIEHGQDNVIDRNRVVDNGTAVELWANPSEPADWGYPQHRDTRSRDNRVVGNLFAGNQRPWRLQRTSGLDVDNNQFAGEVTGDCDPAALLGDELRVLAPDTARLRLQHEEAFSQLAFPDLSAPGFVPGLLDVADDDLARLARRGRDAIVVGEWGPYAWRFPELRPLDGRRDEVRLRVLGPAGEWRVVERRGIEELSATTGRQGDIIRVQPEAATRGDWSLQLEFVGDAAVSPRGTAHPRGTPVRFGYERFEPIRSWQASFYAWTDPRDDPAVPGAAVPMGAPQQGDVAADTDPERDAGFARLLAAEPVLVRAEERLDYQWYRPQIAELPLERWALQATTTVQIGPGEYSLRAISDDGIRVWVDDELVIDNWRTPHGSMVDYAPLAPGRHDLRVQYYQLGGWAELRVDIVKGSPRSAGSAGSG